jgi:hypothetical protein
MSSVSGKAYGAFLQAKDCQEEGDLQCRKLFRTRPRQPLRMPVGAAIGGGKLSLRRCPDQCMIKSQA